MNKCRVALFGRFLTYNTYKLFVWPFDICVGKVGCCFYCRCTLSVFPTLPLSLQFANSAAAVHKNIHTVVHKKTITYGWHSLNEIHYPSTPPLPPPPKNPPPCIEKKRTGIRSLMPANVTATTYCTLLITKCN